MTSKRIHLPDAAATSDIGRLLAAAIMKLSEGRFVIHLRGQLGAGKTTFSRGFLRGLGYEGKVPSPTYTLIEPYDLQPKPVYHMDLYRLHDGAELEFLGLEDLPENAILLIEWPERATDALGAA
ncbi:MAG: tRNA (adenosine(37)-N6)-threonylcarbamoyltransferase complex ATPase subunit type 1 TsaE, partial [Gammaproteobacteria bacterium]|nr:tRNA (adenosine(37)-N6)-threonylcarbamoyltransferase complex ATPase subunit type 1 TsaE [Gammaproteobacteria bacterium]